MRSSARIGTLGMLMAAVFGSAAMMPGQKSFNQTQVQAQSQSKRNKMRKALSSGRLYKPYGNSLNLGNQRQRRKLVAQNPHLRKRVLG